jgi:hypothetical protein
MREFTKSMMSYTWAMSVFGMQQMVNILTPQGQGQEHPATRAFRNVAECTEEEMGGVMRATYRAGDNIQRGLVDVMFGLLTLGAFNPGGGTRTTSNIGQQSAEAFRQGVNAMGQATETVGRAARATAAGQRGEGDAAQSGSTGWGPVPPPTGDGRRR